MSTAKDAIKLAKEQKAVAVDFKFLDFLGIWQHFTTPTSELEEHVFEEGLGFDGSSIRGWQPINASDMLVVPDATTAVMDPFMPHPTLSLICNIVDPITKEEYSRDPREHRPQGRGVPQVDRHRRHRLLRAGARVLHPRRRPLRSERALRLLLRRLDRGPVEHREGRAPEPRLQAAVQGRLLPGRSDRLASRTSAPRWCSRWRTVGLRVEKQHHEVATAGQAEIDLRFLPLVKMGDALMWYKYIVKNVARRHGKTATFMPKPIFGDNGSGMHVHQSIWKGEKPLFAGDGYGGMSELGMHYIAGILKHAPALCAFVAPDRQQLPPAGPGLRGAGQPGVLVAQPLRGVPHPDVLAVAEGEAHRGALPGSVLQRLHGVRGDAHGRPRRHRAPPEPGRSARQGHLRAHARGAEGRAVRAGLACRRRSNALEKDHEFLLKGDVFTEDVIETWIEYKRTKEIDPLRLRPHPYEFALYYDA